MINYDLIKINKIKNLIKVIIKLLNGPRYVVTCKKAIDTKKLKVGIRVALDFSTLTIMRILPREIDPVVFSMIADGNFFKLFLLSLIFNLKQFNFILLKPNFNLI